MSGRGTEDLGRPTTAAGIPHIRAIDGLRLYSLLGVVFLHLIIGSGVFALASHSEQVVIWWLLGTAIDGFFIISGFGLFLGVISTGGRIENLGGWALRRCARLLPAYWLALAVILVVIAIEPVPPRGIVLPDVRELGLHVVGLQHQMRLFDGSFPIGFNIAFAMWMLSVIISFYVVFPLISRGYYKHPFVGLAIAAAITLAWREFVLHDPEFFLRLENGLTPAWVNQMMATDQLPGWAFSFALGMTGAWLYHRHRTAEGVVGIVSPRVGLGVAAAGLISFSFFGLLVAESSADYSSPLGNLQTRVHEPLLGLAYTASRALLFAGIVLAPLWLQAPFANRPVRLGAELSYAVYLIHMPVALYVGGMLLDIRGDGELGSVLALFAAVLSVSFAYAFLSNRLVERPAIRWARRASSPDAEPVAIAARSPAPP